MDVDRALGAQPSLPPFPATQEHVSTGARPLAAAALTALSLCSAEVGTIFALSWLITWFGHVLSDLRHVVRLYDFFLACHPLMPLYFAAVVGTAQTGGALTGSYWWFGAAKPGPAAAAHVWLHPHAAKGTPGTVVPLVMDAGELRAA